MCCPGGGGFGFILLAVASGASCRNGQSGRIVTRGLAHSSSQSHWPLGGGGVGNLVARADMRAVCQEDVSEEFHCSQDSIRTSWITLHHFIFRELNCVIISLPITPNKFWGFNKRNSQENLHHPVCPY